jgi:hypothetical protein
MGSNSLPTDRVKRMAYLRKEQETVEIDHPLDKVWTAIQKVLADLDWNIQEKDETAHRVKAKTTAGPMSWSSMVLINAVAMDEKVTRVSVAGETPFTTISAIIDFGQGKRRINQFLAELAKQLAN